MNPAFVYGLLFVAVALEVVGTSALQMSQQFSRLWPSLLVFACYGGAFYCLSFVLRTIRSASLRRSGARSASC